MKISVIIPTFRRPQRLWQALMSIGQQTWTDVEVLVVNNGGIDIDEQIARYQTLFHRPIRRIWLPEPQTIGAARNAGLQIATGTFVAFLDDDDRWRQDHLANLAQELVDHPEAVLAYDAALIQIEASSAQDEVPQIDALCRFGIPYDPISFESDDYIVTSTLLVRCSALAAIGGFDSTLTFCEDWDLLLRLRAYGQFRFVDRIGAEYSMRIAAQDNSGSVFDTARQKALDELTQRYHLPPLVPKTFYDVAHDFGCQIVHVEALEERILE